jgi:chemosensory pili system protein ChpB (putative protein-glutamate methylesterase)
MSEALVRVALLARAGKARDQLHRALGDAGASIVVEGDPNELDPAQVAGLSPTCYLVGLEPAVERALDRFDDLLAAPGVEVMFDDAEVSARLDGWDLNRWARHIAAKLTGRDANPPVPDGTHYIAEGGASADAGPAFDRAAFAPDAGGDADDLSDSIEMDAGDAGGAAEATGALDLDALDLDLASMGFSTGDDGDASGTSGDDLSDSIDFSSAGDGDGALDLDVAELTAQLEAYESSGRRMPSLDASVGGDDAFEVEAIEAIAVPDAPTAAAAATAAPAKPAFDFSNLALAPMEGAAQAAGASATADAPEQAGAMQPTAAGAVVILAGLGGPDAVRQLLSSLPDHLSVPVLLYQHLEVGKHERLVDQLAKISRLPVRLACEGASPAAGTVWLLPANMTAGAHGDALVFEPGVLAQLIAALPPEDSMVVVLSGADPQLVPMILEMGEAGGLVLAQDPDVCFDAAASEAMQRQGAAVYPALGLARQIAARWAVNA